MAKSYPGFPEGAFTSENPETMRLRTDMANTGFYEGREFRLVREITAPIVYKFSAPVEFILTFQGFSISDGEYKFYAWRAGANLSETAPFNTVEPIFGKNVSNTRPLIDNGGFYQPKVTIRSGGSINVVDRNLYADFEWLKTATATGQQISLEGSGREERYLPVNDYYLEFTGTGSGSFRLTWEERPL